MSNLQLYSLISCYVDGALLTQEGSVTIRRMTNSQPVTTVANGYSGESPGAAMIEVDVENAVPAADFEFQPGTYMSGLVPAEMTLFAANRTLTVKGFIYEDDFSHAVNSAAKLSFKFRGKYDGEWTA